MDNLIPTINNLQDIFHTLGERENIELPQIVAIGGQGSGKSSVLENLVGSEFLPRGTGIVTRCPIVVQLINVNKRAFDEDNGSDGDDDETPQEWIEFNHKPGIKYTDFKKVHDEILEETTRNAGSDKDICDIPIHIKVFSTKVINLTIIDLPGLVQVAVAGQPEDIQDQIQQLVLKYILNPNSIILAVTAANSDMATSEGLNLAKRVDPNGNRTLAVVTKLDLMDPGTDAMDILTGKIIPVKLGIIGNVNRSHMDNEAGKSIVESLKDEAKFFKSNYRSICEKHGTGYLAELLNRQLTEHIHRCLPDLKERIKSLRQIKLKELESCGEELKPEDGSKTLLNEIALFTKSYTSELFGSIENCDTGKLNGGARISCMIHDILDKDVLKIHPINDLKLSDMEIITAVRNSAGAKRRMFSSEAAFEVLVKAEIKQLLQPCLKTLEAVFAEMDSMILDCEEKIQTSKRFPKLYRQIRECSKRLLEKQNSVTKEVVENVINMELAYINKTHPEFNNKIRIALGLHFTPNLAIASDFDWNNHENDVRPESPQLFNIGSNNMTANEHVPKQFVWTTPERVATEQSAVIKPQKATPKTQRRTQVEFQGRQGNLVACIALRKLFGKNKAEQEDCKKIREFIKAYFDVVRRGVQDSVPKAIMYFLVNFVEEHLRNELINQIYSPITEEVEELLAEPEQVRKIRRNTQNFIKGLDEASNVLDEISDMPL